MEVIVIAEGPTEERFIKQLIAPALRPVQVFVKPLLLQTSPNAKGGAVTFDRFKFYARNTLRQHRQSVVSTFLDLYALDTSFPALDAANAKGTLAAKVQCLNEALHQAIVQEAQCQAERFIAHIQPHEFEGLLFANTDALAQTEPDWQPYARQLAQMRGQYETPEHINDGFDTAPSRRLSHLLSPRYKKTRHGPLAAQRVTLEVMERECPHFRAWMEKLRALGRACDK